MQTTMADSFDDLDEYDPTPYGGERRHFASGSEPSAYDDDALETEHSSYAKPRPNYGFQPGSGRLDGGGDEPGYVSGGGGYGKPSYREDPPRRRPEEEFGSGGGGGYGYGEEPPRRLSYGGGDGSLKKPSYGRTSYGGDDSSKRLKKYEALERLASIDLIELCNEAKEERCRATRDLRSCGRVVQYVLNSCGHASLCAECSQRCDVCPICRIPIPKNDIRLQLRLYYECSEAGLITKKYDDRFQEEGDGQKPLAADVQRLHSLFDVSLENNLVSLICHYVTDVCMDKSAVSSDPVIAFLLDEAVVKEWCRRTSRKILTDLCRIYALDVEDMRTRLSTLQKFSLHLSGLSNVLEVLESSIKGTLSAPYGLHCLLEDVLKAKQHLEIMIWCIRHQFLQNIKSRYPNHMSWCSLFRERKSAALKRSWPGIIKSNSAKPIQHDGSTLFIEDALSNLEVEQGYEQEIEKEIDIMTLAKDGSSSFCKSKIEGGCYPFESLRAAADMLFLCSSSDMVVAKQAIFLYYLFDRHWTIPDEKWRYLLDDFAASFSITRHSLLESLTFYLLDDHTDQALQEACSLLPEIAGPERHPKIAQVLLERQHPDAALMVLRWYGYDGLCADTNSDHGRAQLVSLPVAVTAVRVRVECGLLTEAFMYQRSHCLKVKEEKAKHGLSQDFLNNLKGECDTWLDWMEALVTEICCLCIRRNLVDRMIELPWNFDEEKYLHKCLLDCAVDEPSTISGSLLVVFYLQRSRFIEAYQVDRKLQSLEQDFMSKGSTNENVMSKMRSTSQWRTGLVEKCIELLPAVQQEQLKAGNFDIDISPGKEVESMSISTLIDVQAPKSSSSLLTPLLPFPSKKSPTSGTQPKFSGYVTDSEYKISSYSSPSILHRKFHTAVRAPNKDDLFFKQTGTPLKEVKRSSKKAIHHDRLRDDQLDKDNDVQELNPVSGTPTPPSYKPRKLTAPTNDVMDFSWSYGNADSSVEGISKNEELRWRCDETSDDENDPTPMRGTRSSRFSRG